MAVRQDASTEGLRITTGLVSSTSYTIAGWFRKRGAGDGTWEHIFGLLSSGASDWQILYKRIAGSDFGTIHGSVGDTSIGVTLATDTWYYVAIGCNGTTTTSLTGWVITTAGTVYTASVSGRSFTPAELSLLKSGGYGEWVNGAVANVIVWNTKLTTAQLQSQMWSASPVVQTGNVHAWWDLKLHTDLTDKSGAGRNLVSMGGTLTTEDDPPGLYSNIDLDLVTYTSTFNNITILENEITSLGLVTYSSTINDITILENEPVPLDLVTYSSTINDIAIIESEPVHLDLVTYSSAINDITIVESEQVQLDLVTYSSTVNDIVVIESELLTLDLVTYSSTFNDLILIEHEITDLDLVAYSSSFNDIVLYENDIISLDLVSYNSIFNDISVTETELEYLDLVTYISAFNDITVTEAEVLELDLVLYDSTFNSISITETELVYLDLVLYTSTYNDILFDSFTEQYSVDLTRCYSIHNEDRLLVISLEERVAYILKENRTISIT